MCCFREILGVLQVFCSQFVDIQTQNSCKCKCQSKGMSTRNCTTFVRVTHLEGYSSTSGERSVGDTALNDDWRGFGVQKWNAPGAFSQKLAQGSWTRRSDTEIVSSHTKLVDLPPVILSAVSTNALGVEQRNEAQIMVI